MSDPTSTPSVFPGCQPLSLEAIQELEERGYKAKHIEPVFQDGCTPDGIGFVLDRLVLGMPCYQSHDGTLFHHLVESYEWLLDRNLATTV